MKNGLLVVIVLAFCLHANAQVKEHIDTLVDVIAFGSCGKQGADWPVLNQVAANNADAFIFLGDNIYGDTKNMATLQKKYDMLGAKPEFQALWNKPVIATWDDHDYGVNDGGKEYPKKVESKNIFLDFWKAPSDDIRRARPGIYTSYYFEGNGKTVQVIVLDTRTFRDKLKKYRGQTVNKAEYHYGLDYWPHDSEKPTMLGKAQWQWLETQLQVPADVRIIASSTQFGITWNGYEAWANFPHERQKFLDLIAKHKARGVLFISGDVHYSELSLLETKELYPIYDFTSSGITSKWRFATPNYNRIEGPFMENHLGFIKINWSEIDPTITLECVDVAGVVQYSKQIKLSEIGF